MRTGRQLLRTLLFTLLSGSVSHTQAPTSTIVTMTMPSHSSHATAVTTSNIPVGKCCMCSHKSLYGISSAYDQAFMSEVVGLFSYY